jgi:hypothetical protein
MSPITPPNSDRQATRKRAELTVASLVQEIKSENRDSRLLERRNAMARMLRLREEAIQEGMMLKSEDEINLDVARRRGVGE